MTTQQALHASLLLSQLSGAALKNPGPALSGAVGLDPVLGEHFAVIAAGLYKRLLGHTLARQGIQSTDLASFIAHGQSQPETWLPAVDAFVIQDDPQGLIQLARKFAEAGTANG